MPQVFPETQSAIKELSSVLIRTRNNWVQIGGVAATGCAFLPDGTFLSTSELAAYVSAHLDPSRPEPCLQALNGSFAFVVEGATFIIAGVDRVRSIPLFYALSSASGPLISDSAIELSDRMGSPPWDETALCEFYATGCVFGNRTFAPEIGQLQAGQYLTIARPSRQNQVKYYYRHLHTPKENFDPGAFRKKLATVESGMAERMLARAKGRKIVVPLSGGYDSRYIVSLLKRSGASNVLLYSYGRSSSFEVETATQVAKQMEYPFHFIEYTDQKWAALLASDLFVHYASKACQLASLPHIQDLVAVQELRSSGLIEDRAVVMPGFCGDVLGGSFLPLEIRQGVPHRLLAEGLVNYLYRRHVNIPSAPFSKPRRKLLQSSIEASLEETTPGNIDEFVSLNEEWLTRHRLSKFIVNALRVYELFGLDWHMPLWDSELVDLWHKVPFRFRIGNALYNETLFATYFTPLNIAFKKPAQPQPSKLRGEVKRLLPHAVQNLATRAINRLSGRTHQIWDFNAFRGIAEVVAPALHSAGINVASFNINHHCAAWLMLQPWFGYGRNYSLPGFLK